MLDFSPLSRYDIFVAGSQGFNMFKDIILKYCETFFDRYRMANFNMSCTAERSIISTVCGFYKDDVNKEQFHSKTPFLASNDLNQWFSQ